jgi:hypothetical protein
MVGGNPRAARVRRRENDVRRCSVASPFPLSFSPPAGALVRAHTLVASERASVYPWLSQVIPALMVTHMMLACAPKQRYIIREPAHAEPL